MGLDLGELTGGAALAVSVLLILAETGLLVGVVLPATSTLLGLGAVTRVGELPVLVAAPAIALAAVVGGNLGFLRGRAGRDAERPGPVRRLEARVAPAIARFGPFAVLGGQWLAGVRTVMPRLAGAAGLPHPVFAALHAPVAVLWGAGLVLLGNAGVAFWFP